MEKSNLMEKIVSLCKRRGFVFPSSEIYGGIGGFYDFGPMGIELKNNIKQLWWQNFVLKRDDVVGIESSIIMNRKVWQASGHEKGFVDELVECKKCHLRFRLDEIEAQNPKLKCQIGGEHEMTEPKLFNAMFKTHVGVVEDQESLNYLRPETAQGMFADYKQVLETSRMSLPFGIAQIGKSFRNEINTKDWLFRVREFEIAEIEYFVRAGEDEKYFDQWLADWKDFVLGLGIKKEDIKYFEHPKESLAHYSKRTVDINFHYPFGWKELTGLANRTDFDLSSHEKASGRDMKYFDEESKEKFIPYVIEPTMGVERLMLAVLLSAYSESDGSDGREKGEVVLKFKPKIAPIKVGVFPLVKKDKLLEVARGIAKSLKEAGVMTFCDEAGSIGRRYRRQDEIGTPFCITVDYDTLKDNAVTIRERDSMKQERVKISEIEKYITDKIK